jgi:hypothetical protein
MPELRTQARFPEIARKAGHYESFYVKAAHPAEPLGVWIRYTVHKRPGAEPTGSLWFTLFDGAADGPRACKVTTGDVSASGADYVRIGESRLGDGRLEGRAVSEACEVEWELAFESGEEPLYHLPRGWMYRAPIPRTKLLTPYPGARFSGYVNLDGERVELEGWPGMVGHNWGSQHAERWIWVHGARFEGDSGSASWLDVALGRIKLGPVTTPWIANGGLSLDGVRHRLGGPERAPATEVRESPERCELVLPGKGITVQAEVGSAPKNFVGWVYADPDGSEHHTVNCSISDMTLTVSRPGMPPLTLKLAGGAAYELGMRERDHGVPIQPFPDG